MGAAQRGAAPGMGALDRRAFLRMGGGLGFSAFLTACGGGGGSGGGDADGGDTGGGDPGGGSGPVPTRNLPDPGQEYSVLKRTSFGVHRDALADIRANGVPAYLERQLAYESIDDTVVNLAVTLNYLTLALPTLVNRAGFPGNTQTLTTDIVTASLFRSIFSRRQLYEVMVEFWSNHFSIDVRNGLEPVLKRDDDVAVIRPNAMGTFPALLKASAKSPAMLFSLDNFLNQKSAPNENYARELMELHTLGVDGGYTEQDIKEVARCFTGWSIDTNLGSYQYRSDVHDDGAKTVLGQAIAAGGQEQDGRTVLDILANHPSTATHIATKLCRRFIADDPPAGVVADVAATYRATGGDIRSMLRTLFASGAFLDARDEKLDRPVEFVAQIVRTLNPQLAFPSDKGAAYLSVVNLMGQTPFFWSPPDGYPDIAEHWSSTSAFLNRWRIALYAVGSGLFDLNALAGTAASIGALVDTVAAGVLQRPLLAADRQTLVSWLSGLTGTAPDAAVSSSALKPLVPALVAMLISSAYFQVR